MNSDTNESRDGGRKRQSMAVGRKVKGRARPHTASIHGKVVCYHNYAGQRCSLDGNQILIGLMFLVTATYICYDRKTVSVSSYSLAGSLIVFAAFPPTSATLDKTVFWGLPHGRSSQAKGFNQSSNDLICFTARMLYCTNKSIALTQ